MSIDRTKPGAVSPSGGVRPDQAGGGNHSARQPVQGQRTSPEDREQDGHGDDRVHLSDEVRAVGMSGLPSASGLSAPRLQEILKRLTSGYYDSPQVRDRIAQRVKDDVATLGHA
jgi:hypothetical protein